LVLIGLLTLRARRAAVDAGQQRIHDGTQVVTGDSRPLLAGRRVELPALKLTMTDNAEDAWGSQLRPRSSAAADCPSND